MPSSWKSRSSSLRVKQWSDDDFAVVYDAASCDCMIVHAAAASLLVPLIEAAPQAMSTSELHGRSSVSRAISSAEAERLLVQLAEAHLVEECPR